ncbi:hypothetical protein E4T49_04158 [Aureobasidium sp. EXF-10728]|nr:hypothetical protein E4T49_04158 [Aureobasidium sp. EXF-10728]
MAGSIDMAPSLDQEMAEQQQAGGLKQQGMSQAEQEAHDLEIKGFCITSWNQVCHTGEVAKARRNRAGKQPRQNKEKNNTAYNRDRERLLQQKNFELNDLYKRVGKIREEFVQEIQRITRTKNQELEAKNLELQRQCMKISEMDAAQQELEREHQAELESHEQMQATLLGDLHDLCQVNEEEIEALRRTIDQQALPPTYSNINSRINVPKITDGSSADAQTVISSAITSLRKAIAEPEPARHANPLIHIADTLRASLLTIKRSHTTKLWPRSTTALALHATHECVDRVIMYLSLHLSLYAHLPLPPRFLSRLPDLAKKAHTSLRRAFTAADTLALELCSMHFASGGRRAQLLAVPTASLATPTGIMDSNDDFLELQIWKKRFEGTRREAREWKNEVGVVVFYHTVNWLEQEIMAIM